MKFVDLVEIVKDEPLFETGLLLVGNVDPVDVRRQLSRWTTAGLIFQLRRGLYGLAPPFQHVRPHPFLVANHMVHGSYVSCQSGLAYAHMIPEFVPVTTSVTTGPPRRWDTPLGRCEFRHIKTPLLYGFELMELGEGQRALVAKPEKALLDLIHLHPGGDSPHYLQELRLQHLDRLDLSELRRHADRAGSPKLLRATEHITTLAREEGEAYESL